MGHQNKRKAEKFQKTDGITNRHKLTRWQHVLPKKSIERFVGNDGCVAVQFIKEPINDRLKRLQPKDPLFCADRVWDQHSEDNMKNSYEDPFQELAERIILGNVQALDPNDSLTVTLFWGLWRARFQARLDPPEDKPVFGVTGIESKDTREEFEKKHVACINPDKTIPGRNIARMDIQKFIDWTLINHNGWSWNIARTTESEFLVSDGPNPLNTMDTYRPIYVPISPSICLMANNRSQNGTIYFKKGEVLFFNKTLLTIADKYIFCKNTVF